MIPTSKVGLKLTKRLMQIQNTHTEKKITTVNNRRVNHGL